MPLGQHLRMGKTKLSMCAKMTHVQGYLDIRGASSSSPAAGWVLSPQGELIQVWERQVAPLRQRMRAEEEEEGSGSFGVSVVCVLPPSSASSASSTGFLRRNPILMGPKRLHADLSLHSFEQHNFSQGQIPL